MSLIDISKLKGFFGKNKLLLAALAAGLLLLLLPLGGGGEKPAAQTQTESFDLSEQEQRLSKHLSLIRGAGRVKVLLSAESTGERILARNGEETLVISSGSGSGEKVVELNYVNPVYTGAIVISDGADNATVRLQLVEAVMRFTQLGSDEVLVIQMEE